MAKRKSGLFPYFGGKALMIAELQKLFDDLYYDCFYDLFGGSGAITLNTEHRCFNQVLNDMDKSLAIVYIAIADRNLFYQFSDLVESMHATTEQAVNARRLWFGFIKKYPDCNLFELAEKDKEFFLELAAVSYLLHNVSYGGVIKDCQCIPNDETYDKFEKRKQLDMLEPWHDKLCDVKITNMNALDAIDNFIANPSTDKVTLLYLDVPYLSTNESDIKTGKTYTCGMSKDIHLQLLERLNKLDKSYYKIIISNYANELYDRFAEENGWHKMFIKERPLACKRDKNGETVNEYVYINYDPIIHGQ